MPEKKKSSDLNARKAAEARAKQAEAEAKAAASQADAERAKADAERIRAETEAKRLDAEQRRLETQTAADAKKRADEAAARSERETFELLVQGGTYATGLAAGAGAAHIVDGMIIRSIDAKNEALKALGGEAAKLTERAGGASNNGKRSTAKLKATVAVADKTGVSRPGRGRAGLITGGGLIAMGLATRAYGESKDSETAQAIYGALGTAEIVAGGTVLAHEAAASYAPKKIADVKAMAQIEQGRAIARGEDLVSIRKPMPEADAVAPEPKAAGAQKSKAPKGAKSASRKMIAGMSQRTDGAGAMAKTAKTAKTPKGGPRGFANAANQAAAQDALAEIRGVADDAANAVKSASRTVAKGAAKLSVLALPAVAGYMALDAYNSSAEAGDSTLDASLAGAKAGADVVTGGALSVYDELAAKAGDDTVNKVAAAITATAVGAANTVGFGAPSLIGLGAEGETMKYDAKAAADKANAAAAEKTLAAGGKPTKAQMAALDKVRGAAGDAVDTALTAGLGAAVAIAGLGTLKSAADKSFITPKTLASRAANLGRTAGGLGMLAVGGVMIADAATGGAKADDGSSVDDPQTPLVVGGAAGVAAGTMAMHKATTGMRSRPALFIGGTAALVAGATALATGLAGGAKAEEGAGAGDAAVSPAKGTPRKLSATQTAQLKAETTRIASRATAKAAAEKAQSDGMTDPYSRRGPGGNIVEVRGYRTVIPTR